MRLGPVLLLAGIGWGHAGVGALQEVQEATAVDPSVQESPPVQDGPLAQSLEITEELMAIRDSVESVLVAQDTVMGPERQVQLSVVRGWLARSSELQQELIEVLPGLAPPQGDSAGAVGDSGAPSPEVADGLELIRSRVVEYTRWLQVAYRDQRDRQMAALERLAAARVEATPEEVAVIDGERRLRSGQVDTLYIREAELLSKSEALGVDVDEGWRELEQAGLSRADGLTGRLQLALLDRDRVRQELEDAERAGLSEAEIARIRNELQTVERRIEDLSRTLGTTADFLDSRGLGTAGYRRLMIESTGVTGDILKRDVFFGLVADSFRDLSRWVRTRGPTVLVRALIVLFFVFVGRVAARLIWWFFPTLGLVHLPRLATELVGRMVGPLGTLVGLGVGLSVIGVDTTTVLAGAGVAGVVLGFALQDSIANFAAGFLILLYRPFDQDHVIEAAGVVGKVRSMGLANTTLLTFDNRRVSIPNSKLWGTVIANRSSEPTRRAEALLRVGFDQDLGRVSDIVLARLEEHELVLSDPAPSLYVSGSGASWMEVTVWAWAENADWWTVTAALPELLKAALEAGAIPVPLPTQRVVGLQEQGHETEPIVTRTGR